MRPPSEKSAMPVSAGIFKISSGGFKFLLIQSLLVASIFFPVSAILAPGMKPAIFLLVIILPLIFLEILAVVCGIGARKRKHFGLAVAGAYAAFPPFSLVDLALTVSSRSEFKQ